MRTTLDRVSLLSVVAILLSVSTPGRTQQVRPVDAPYAQLIRTGDVSVRGLTAEDFPRVKKLAENIYAYEELANPIESNAAFTTNSLIVVTRDGVVVVDGQANEAQTRKLVETIATLTPQPIKYVIIGADHGDHIFGNGAFPAGVTFIAHQTSKAVIERLAVDGRGRAGAPRPRVPIPQETVSDKRVLKLADTEMQILFLGEFQYWYRAANNMPDCVRRVYAEEDGKPR